MAVPDELVFLYRKMFAGKPACRKSSFAADWQCSHLVPCLGLGPYRADLALALVSYASDFQAGEQ